MHFGHYSRTLWRWGWFVNEDPRMHILDMRHPHGTINEREPRKLWLEDRGVRCCVRASGDLKGVRFKRLCSAVSRHRIVLERRWVTYMLMKAWLEIRKWDPDTGILRLVAYPKHPDFSYERVVDIKKLLPRLWRDATPDLVVRLNLERAALCAGRRDQKPDAYESIALRGIIFTGSYSDSKRKRSTKASPRRQRRFGGSTITSRTGRFDRAPLSPMLRL